MSTEHLPQPELGGDLVRVHRAITRALAVAQDRGRAALAAGDLQAETREGYLTFVRCLTILLHGHHLTEDEAMFPSLRPRLPDAPYEALMGQHRAMGPPLDDVERMVKTLSPGKARKALSRLVSGTGQLDGQLVHRIEDSALLSELVSGLEQLDELWQTHIELEEAYFGPAAIAQVMTMEERERAGRATGRHAARHQRPFSLLLPFFMYNMVPADRAVMAQTIPGIAFFLMRVFRRRWQAMTPFLLDV